MIITWYGQSCFRLQGTSVVLVIDPFSKDIGLTPQRGRADVVLVSHHHSDHDNVRTIEGEPIVADGPGEYEAKGVAVRGILADHDEAGGTLRGKVTIYTIELENIRFCHLADLGQKKLTQEQIGQIGEVDVLFVPVGGTYTIGPVEAAEVVSHIEPRVVIPMHYRVPGLTLPLEPAARFFKEMGVTPEVMSRFVAKRKDLPTAETRVIELTLEK
ncbi:MBL fold metallo-hydrolase [Candidatus Parcubacteria bacterium]|nr:MBL fold metallo-hydrolase [Candidatus Parcubacteria bacterium]